MTYPVDELEAAEGLARDAANLCLADRLTHCLHPELESPVLAQCAALARTYADTLRRNLTLH